MHDFTLASLSRAIQNRDVSPVEVTEACLARIDSLDRALNAFITLTPDRALADARRAEHEIAGGHRRGPLHGVPLAVKDIFATAGVRTTCGSRVLRAWVPAEDATVVRRLREAGAVFLGKLNMSEFGGATACRCGPDSHQRLCALGALPCAVSHRAGAEGRNGYGPLFPGIALVVFNHG